MADKFDKGDKSDAFNATGGKTIREIAESHGYKDIVKVIDAYDAAAAGKPLPKTALDYVLDIKDSEGKRRMLEVLIKAGGEPVEKTVLDYARALEDGESKRKIISLLTKAGAKSGGPGGMSQK